MPLEPQLSSGALHLASKSANQHQDPQPQGNDDSDCPPGYKSARAKRRGLVIDRLVLSQFPQPRIMDGDGTR